MKFYWSSGAVVLASSLFLCFSVTSEVKASWYNPLSFIGRKLVKPIAIKALPRDHWVHTFLKTSICESKLYYGKLVPTEDGSDNCRRNCEEKGKLLSVHLKEIFEKLLLKINRVTKAKVDDRRLEVIFVSENQYNCEKNSKGNGLNCVCPFRMELYGTAESKTLIDNTVRSLATKQNSSIRQESYAGWIIKLLLTTGLVVVAMLIIHFPPAWFIIPIIFLALKLLKGQSHRPATHAALAPPQYYQPPLRY